MLFGTPSIRTANTSNDNYNTTPENRPFCQTLCNLHMKRLNHAMVPCPDNDFRQPCCQLCSALDSKTATFQPITTAAKTHGKAAKHN